MKTLKVSAILIVFAVLVAIAALGGVRVYGADINIQPGDDATAKWKTHRDGDTIIIHPGTYSINGSVDLANGAKVIPAVMQPDVWNATINFSTGNSSAAINLRGSNNLIRDLALSAPCGIFKGNNLNGTIIEGCRLEWGWAGTYYNRLAIGGWGSAIGCKIRYNLFDNSKKLRSDGKPPDDRSLEVWGQDGPGSVIGNEFYHVNDGGHYMNPLNNFEFAWNVQRFLRRMGGEFQQNYWNPAVAPTGHTLHDNVAYDWYGQYWDSMIWSDPVCAKGLRIYNNYGRANETWKWQEPDSSGNLRGSYGIEGPNSPDFGAVVENNIIIGERMVQGISSPSKNLDCKDNKFFGADFAWGVMGGEPGNDGHGSIDDKGGNVAVRASSRADAAAKMGTYPQPPRLITLKRRGQQNYVPPTTQPTPPPPDPGAIPPPPEPVVKAFKSMVQVGAIPTGAKLQRRAGDNVFVDVTPVNGFDSAFKQDQIDNRWRWRYSHYFVKDGNKIVSGEVEVQLNALNGPPDPTTPPTTQPTPTPPTETILDGTPWDITIPIEGGKPNFTKATTRPSN